MRKKQYEYVAVIGCPSDTQARGFAATRTLAGAGILLGWTPIAHSWDEGLTVPLGEVVRW